MQKNSTAIRITHIPTGIVVTCQNERSQHRNRESAMRVLEARLIERELERHAEEQAKIKGEHVSAGWSNQIRSYVLHPYKMVKDHRTGYETSNAAAVLEGDLDEVIQAYLKSQVGRVCCVGGHPQPHLDWAGGSTPEAGRSRRRGSHLRAAFALG